MEATIVNYRGSHKTHNSNQMIIVIEGIDSKEKAEGLKNKKVIWKSPAGKELTGTVTKTHGNKGALRVYFEKGLPGQSIGTKVKLQ